MIFFCHIDEVKVHGKGSNDLFQLAVGNRCNALLDFKSCGFTIVMATMTARLTESLHGVKQLAAALLAQHVAQNASQKRNVSGKGVTAVIQW